jgi:membrane protein DedA with SNARE-associated domain
MDLAALIQQYSYMAVFVGSVLEGETLLVLAGLAGAGYALGSAVEPLLEEDGEFLIFGTVIFVGVILWLLGRRRARHRSKEPVSL